MQFVSVRIATAPLAAAGLIGAYAVAVISGSRPLGGVVLAAFGLTCIAIWLRRDGRRTAALLAGTGLLAFALSHVLALAIGGWPAVLVVAAATAAVSWTLSDARRFDSPRPDDRELMSLRHNPRNAGTSVRR